MGLSPVTSVQEKHHVGDGLVWFGFVCLGFCWFCFGFGFLVGLLLVGWLRGFGFGFGLVCGVVFGFCLVCGVGFCFGLFFLSCIGHD